MKYVFRRSLLCYSARLSHRRTFLQPSSFICKHSTSAPQKTLGSAKGGHYGVDWSPGGGGKFRGWEGVKLFACNHVGWVRVKEEIRHNDQREFLNVTSSEEMASLYRTASAVGLADFLLMFNFAGGWIAIL